MKFTRLKVVGIAAGVAALALLNGPVSAGTTTITDGDGVDYDAACIVSTNAAPPPPNSIVSNPASAKPGGSLVHGGDGCTGISNYDGLTETTDIRNVTMSSTAVGRGNSTVQLSASVTVDGPIPPPGSTCHPATADRNGGNPPPSPNYCPDLPTSTDSPAGPVPTFVGAGYKVMFQVPARQNNTPTNSVGGGCPRFPAGQVFDQHDHWLDGHHHFIGFDVAWDGTRWIWSAQIGTYDAAPDGAFFFTELGTNSTGTWSSADPNATFGTHWNVSVSTSATGPSTVTVAVDGVVGSADAVNCANGVFNTVYAKSGDTITNVKALSTVDATVTLPVTVPLSLVPGFSDITSVGGFIFYSDVTGGNSRNVGLVGSMLQPNPVGASYSGGSLGISDNLGDSPACPTPTFGGTVPTNPFLNPAFGCQYDDDNIPIPNPVNPTGPWIATDFPTGEERGTFFPEWWDTGFGFTA